ncbi:fumarylacetoacetate hydrolase family protein [Piscinibacter terrae]|uniref:2-keto-4-pentenoate hydratase n=1 Tax=Piscinibacter terrae TaxID=2496871 RepID=A0A3N7HSB9_9BURK|nr:fumarylacetoacetate hydrolase family protein [Albitalea terrae]RQP25177.1 2-keto-4-pentenoate hydratase [Albitalea terrae]
MSTNELAQALARARKTGQPLRAADWTDAVLDEEQAYAVQDEVAALLGWAPQGGLVRHWKSGGASRSGPFSHSPLDPAGIDHAGEAGSFLGVEAEIALRLGRDVSPETALSMQPEDVDRCIDAMTVSVELVSSRWQEGLAAPALLRMADHQSHGALQLGAWHGYRRLDWANLSFRLLQQDAVAFERRGGHSLDDPALVVPALLRHLSRGGLTVPAGTIVTTGAWGGMQALSAGSRDGGVIDVSFETLGSCSFKLQAPRP